MKNLKLFFQGFLIGIGKVIPGVSGAVFAVMFGLYNSIIELISSFQGFKKNIIPLLPLILGISSSIMLGSNIIKLLFNISYTNTMYFFMGMMSYGIIKLKDEILIEKVRFKYLVILLAFTIMPIILIVFNQSTNMSNSSYKFYIDLLYCGLIEAFTALVPGISGTSIMMVLGYYEIVLQIFANPFNNLVISFIFGIGILIGAVGFSKLINYLYNCYKEEMNFIIFCLSLFSFILLFKRLYILISFNNLGSLLLSLTLGYTFTHVIDKKFNI